MLLRIVADASAHRSGCFLAIRVYRRTFSLWLLRFQVILSCTQAEVGLVELRLGVWIINFLVVRIVIFTIRVAE